MSDKTTWSPGFSPERISTALTELRPSFTGTRSALPFGCSLNNAVVPRGVSVFVCRSRPGNIHMGLPYECCHTSYWNAIGQLLTHGCQGCGHDNRQSAIDSRQSAVGNRQPAIGNRDTRLTTHD